MISFKSNRLHLFQIFLIIFLFPTTIHPSSIYSKNAGGSYQHNSSANAKEVPLFIAHRGDKFLMPEHTVAAYDLAMLTNVDYVEPDLVMTKDGVLVCHHDIVLREGTDVASHLEFAALMTQNRTVFLDGENVTILNDWIISDFTLAQLKTLRVRQKSTGWRPHFFDDDFEIPTFQEYLDAVHKDTARRQTSIQNGIIPKVMGIIPELKHPDFHNNIVFNSEHRMEREFLTMLNQNGYIDNACKYNGVDIPCSPLIVQCFHVGTIKYLSNTTGLTLLTLLDTQNLRYLTYGGMLELKNKTTYVSMWKDILYTGIEQEAIYKNVSYDKEEIENLGGFVEPQDMVKYAHGLGFKVGIYTIYHSEENSLRGCAVKCEPETSKEEELNYFMDMGVDAFFVEGLSESLRIRDRWANMKQIRGDGKKTSGADASGGIQNHIWTMTTMMVGVVIMNRLQI